MFNKALFGGAKVSMFHGSGGLAVAIDNPEKRIGFGENSRINAALEEAYDSLSLNISGIGYFQPLPEKIAGALETRLRDSFSLKASLPIGEGYIEANLSGMVLLDLPKNLPHCIGTTAYWTRRDFVYATCFLRDGSTSTRTVFCPPGLEAYDGMTLVLKHGKGKNFYQAITAAVNACTMETLPGVTRIFCPDEHKLLSWQFD